MNSKKEGSEGHMLFHNIFKWIDWHGERFMSTSRFSVHSFPHDPCKQNKLACIFRCREVRDSSVKAMGNARWISNPN